MRVSTSVGAFPLTVVSMGTADGACRRWRQGVTRLSWLGFGCLRSLTRCLSDCVCNEVESLGLQSIGFVDTVPCKASSWVGVKGSMDEDSVTRDLSAGLPVLGIHRALEGLEVRHCCVDTNLRSGSSSALRCRELQEQRHARTKKCETHFGCSLGLFEIDALNCAWKLLVSKR